MIPRTLVPRMTLAAALAATTLLPAAADSTGVEQGYVTAADGARLYYVRAGSGAQVVILPGRLFAFRDLSPLAEKLTLISYDMRNRGRSSFVQDNSRITIQDDVLDVEAIRAHFGVERFSLIGYSYLGLMAILYASEHPERIERVVQIGPVPRKFGTEYPAGMTAADNVDQEGVQRLRKLREEQLHLTDPEAYCLEEWKVTSVRLVGDAANAGKVGPGVCEMPNEWPTNLARHLSHHFTSVQGLDIPDERIARVKMPVLTIHGTLDRNAPYGAGREWASLLPDARLLTVEGAAHQVFSERPDVVLPAIGAFLDGRWPDGAMKVSRPGS